jgi:hypothetical protein
MSSQNFLSGLPIMAFPALLAAVFVSHNNLVFLLLAKQTHNENNSDILGIDRCYVAFKHVFPG